jgi:S1-C subfamily serine protease
MKYWFLLATLLIGCQSFPAPASIPPPDHVAAAAMLSDKVVALVVNSRAYCSGVWISPEVILTANHCVAEETVVEYAVREDVFDPGSSAPREHVEPHPAFVSARDTDHDLALLRVLDPAPTHATAVVSSYEIQQGMPVQALGQPLGLWWSYSSGEVAAVRVIENAFGVPTLFVQATCPISPGSSGGGLFDEWGMLVGITHATHTRGQNTNLFVHVRYIRALLAAQL